MRQSLMLVRRFVLALARLLGTELVDCETSRPLGRAFVISWRGKVHVIGLEVAVRPVFLAQKRVTYWKQEIGFTMLPPPDFPRTRDADER